MRLFLKDESCDQKDQEFQIQCFAPSEALLPYPRNEGDIIRFHRLNVSWYENQKTAKNLEFKNEK